MTEPRYMSLETLESYVDAVETTIEKWMALEGFPAPRRIGKSGTRRWDREKVDLWLNGTQPDKSDLSGWSQDSRASADEVDASIAAHREYEQKLLGSLVRVRYGPRIYFVQISDFIKIGFTQDIYQRIQHLLQETPHRLQLLHHEEGDRAGERSYHAKFHHLRFKGEWFRAGADLLKFIEDLKQ